MSKSPPIAFTTVARDGPRPSHGHSSIVSKITFLHLMAQHSPAHSIHTTAFKQQVNQIQPSTVASVSSSAHSKALQLLQLVPRCTQGFAVGGNTLT